MNEWICLALVNQNECAKYNCRRHATIINPRSPSSFIQACNWQHLSPELAEFYEFFYIIFKNIWWSLKRSLLYGYLQTPSAQFHWGAYRCYSLLWNILVRSVDASSVWHSEFVVLQALHKQVGRDVTWKHLWRISEGSIDLGLTSCILSYCNRNGFIWRVWKTPNTHMPQWEYLDQAQ